MKDAGMAKEKPPLRIMEERGLVEQNQKIVYLLFLDFGQ
jgi:hypothetical protein